MRRNPPRSSGANARNRVGSCRLPRCTSEQHVAASKRGAIVVRAVARSCQQRPPGERLPVRRAVIGAAVQCCSIGNAAASGPDRMQDQLCSDLVVVARIKQRLPIPMERFYDCTDARCLAVGARRNACADSRCARRTTERVASRSPSIAVTQVGAGRVRFLYGNGRRKPAANRARSKRRFRGR